MPKGFSVPTSKEVSRMLTFLFGRDVRVGKGIRVRTGKRDRWTLGVYISESNEIVGVCATDLPLASHFGAALSLFPPHMSQKCIAEGTLEDGIWENTLEVFNVVSRYFHEAADGMIQLGDSWDDGSEVPIEVKQFMRRSKRRADLRVNINGYGPGSLALIG
jgi:hypothetical protein